MEIIIINTEETEEKWHSQKFKKNENYWNC